MGTRQQRRGQPPSIAALVVLLLGALASMATSPPSASTSRSGTTELTAAQPVLRFDIGVAANGTDADGYQDSLDFVLEWDGTSETGIEPAFSVVGLEDTELTANGNQPRSVSVDAAQGYVELTLLNGADTGPVDVDWSIDSSLRGATDVELRIFVEGGAFATPSGRVTIPAVWHRSEQPFSLVTIEAEAKAGQGAIGDGSGLGIAAGDSSRGNIANLVAGGSSEPLGREVRTVPWDRCDPECSVTVEVAIIGSMALTAEVVGGDGSITAVTTSPAERTTWVELPAATYLSSVESYQIEVELPSTGDAFDGQIMLLSRLDSSSDPIAGDPNCFLPVERVTDTGVTEEIVSFTTDHALGIPLDLRSADSPLTFDLRVGSTDPGQHCDQDPDTVSVVEIGVRTFGVEEPESAEVTLR